MTHTTGDELRAPFDPFETWFASHPRAWQQENFGNSYAMRQGWNAAIASAPIPSERKYAELADRLQTLVDGDGIFDTPTVRNAIAAIRRSRASSERVTDAPPEGEKDALLEAIATFHRRGRDDPPWPQDRCLEGIWQEGVSWALGQVGKYLGVKEWNADGATESIEGDVAYEIGGILTAAKLYDPETGSFAKLAPTAPEGIGKAETDALASVGYLLDRLPEHETDESWTQLQNGTIRALYDLAKRHSISRTEGIGDGVEAAQTLLKSMECLGTDHGFGPDVVEAVATHLRDKNCPDDGVLAWMNDSHSVLTIASRARLSGVSDLQSRLEDCESALRRYDDGECSEYWLRYPALSTQGKET